MTNKVLRHITLIEVLIVIALLALIGGVIAFNTRGWTQEQKFQSAVEQVVSKLQISQNIMVILNSDVKVEIKQIDEEAIQISIRPEKSVSDIFQQALDQIPRIEGIASFTFGDLEEKRLELLFSALSHQTPTGNLELISSFGEKKYIPFYGYPHFMDVKDEPVMLEEEDNESSLLYPKEVRELWQFKQKSNPEDPE